MNSLKGLGVCVLLAGMILAVTRMVRHDEIVLALTIGIIVMSTTSYGASARRRRNDRRIAGE